ncbi:MAG: hypothetical protein ACI9FN_002701, partial [Saprospiraceae bacterium]
FEHSALAKGRQEEELNFDVLHILCISGVNKSTYYGSSTS